MTQVYCLVWNPISSNNHSLCRDVRLTIKKDQLFNSLEEAEEYVIRTNRRMNMYDLSIQDEKDPEVIRARCLTDPNFVSKRDYHIIPAMDEFRNALLEQLKARGDFKLIIE